MSSFAFVGFGALGESFADGLRLLPGVELRAWLRSRESSDHRGRRDRLANKGVRLCDSLAEALHAADAVVAAVPLGAATEVARLCVESLEPACLYIDPAPSHPRVKAELAALIEAAGGQYVDLAVLGAVRTEGYQVPLLASGVGAERWAALVSPLGFAVTVVGISAGEATVVKLLRSVYLKGRDALVMEMLLAASRYGVAGDVARSIGGRGESVSFPELAERILKSLAMYAERRADELDVSAALLREAGVAPIVATASSERLRWRASLGRHQDLTRRQPSGLEEAVSELDELARLVDDGLQQ